MFKKIALPLTMMFAGLYTNTALAALTWFNNLTITSAGYYWDGSNDVWGISWLETINTGCTVTDTQGKSAYWGSGAWSIGNARLTPAMAALGGNLKVDIEVDTSTCSSTYGAMLEGVRLHR